MDDDLAEYLVTYVEPPNGETHWYFECMAEDADHAREQCKNANPECLIIQVEWIA